jgi:glycosyltransferase involved in cell wall biosynthesis
MTVRVTFLWPEISGYMAACWGALAKRPGVQISILAIEPSAATNTQFSLETVKSLDVTFMERRRIEDSRAVNVTLASHTPDAIVVSGWWNPAYRAATAPLRARGTSIIMAMDTPFRSSLVADIRRVLSWQFFRTIDTVVVPGERGLHLAEALGFAPERIRTGLYGVDRARLAPALAVRKQSGWPRRFLFLGQLTPVKGFDTLIAGYRQYRDRTSDPWPLTVCGAGPLQGLASHTEGVDYRGFVDPADHCSLLAEHGALVLPSRFDPWPLAIVEAATSGLPVLCSTKCGSAVELVRDSYNGRVMPLQDASGIEAGLRWIHDRIDDLPEMGDRSTRLAEPYSAEMWASRWTDYLTETIERRTNGARKSRM